VTPAPVAPTEKPPQPEKAPPATVQPPAAEATGTAWPKLKISGVIGSGKTGAVIINGRTVDVGGRISGVAVEDIRDGAVILKYRNETRKLRSGESL
jgi:hypothetical protein